MTEGLVRREKQIEEDGKVLMASIAAQKAKAEAAGMTFQEYLEMEAANDPRRKGYVTCPANFFGPGAPGRDLKNPHTEHLAGYIGASVSNGGW